MAIKKDFEKPIEGTTKTTLFQGAYWVIGENGINGGKDDLLIRMNILEQKNAPAIIGIFAFSFKPDPNGINYHEQAYEHLKTLDYFKDAVDVLE
ncbi:hypothetical protein C5F61_00110 [Photobacterium damselae subsp. damselae]|uniref:hypothetical protein n=1 Tax=Photobacterium damselae TaxID=38293 RepID=UPI000D04EDC3|nr:hypothetical protein [Photobacterium damselae]PSB82547.1 hypothetical protein C5F61_00110 [Photobacterium damselae subsp. damselae]